MNVQAPGSQRGGALLITLAIVALAAVLAAAMLERGQFSLRQTQVQLRLSQARQLAVGLEDWAIAILQRDYLSDRGPQRDGLRDIWNRALPVTEIPGGNIQGRIVGLSGRINVNTLVGADGGVNALARERFVRLLRRLQLNPAIADQLIDWIDSDGEAMPQGAERGGYSGNPDYPANAPMTHISELRLLPAVDDQAYRRLRPLVYAAPAPASRININTAPTAVLQSLADGLSANLADQIVSRRREALSSVAELLALPALADIALDPAGLDIASRYFLVQSEIVLDGTPVRFESLLQRRASQYHVHFRRQIGDNDFYP